MSAVSETIVREYFELHEFLVRQGRKYIAQTKREDDGRWIAEVTALPGVMAYGVTEAEASSRVKALALRVIADRLDNGEPLPREIAKLFEAA